MSLPLRTVLAKLKKPVKKMGDVIARTKAGLTMNEAVFEVLIAQPQ